MLQASIGTEVAGWQGVATRLFALKRPPLKFSIDGPTPLLSPETRWEGGKARKSGMPYARGRSTLKEARSTAHAALVGRLMMR